MKSYIYFLIILTIFTGCSSKVEPKPQSLSKQEKAPIQEQIKEKPTVDKKEVLSEQKPIPHIQTNTQEINASKEIKILKSKEIDSNFLKPKKRVRFKKLPKTYLVKSSFGRLSNWKKQDYDLALNLFKQSCKTQKTQKLYKSLCKRASSVTFAKDFLQREFTPYKIRVNKEKDKGLLTGYYEPLLRGCLKKRYPYIYPIYETPDDLIVVDLSSIYPKLKNYRLRGKVVGNKLVPYYTRKETFSKHMKSDVICYTDSKIDLFFLEVQGSGRVKLGNGETIYIGYDNQNGHRYKSIGKYLVQKKEIDLDEVSLQSIREWLNKHPKRIDEVLNHNKSVVFFKEREQPATGSLGLPLTSKRSIAVDRRYIPLGSMLYIDAKVDNKKFNSIVFAQDTGGAIKGPVRADLFLGYGKKAMNIAGELKSPLKLWILLPKNMKKEDI